MMLTKEALRVLPIRRIDFTTGEDHRQVLRQTANEACEALSIGGNLDAVLHFANDQLAPDNPRLDVVHDLLALLSQRIMAAYGVVQEEVRGFLAWLEREAGTSIDTLTNKSRIRMNDSDTFSRVARARYGVRWIGNSRRESSRPAAASRRAMVSSANVTASARVGNRWPKTLKYLDLWTLASVMLYFNGGLRVKDFANRLQTC
jgi:hypothetical protein